MRKSKELLGLMAFKLTDKEYAQLAVHASVVNISMGELLRTLIRKLPDVEPELVARWAGHRKRSGHEKQALSLETIEKRLAEASTRAAQLGEDGQPVASFEEQYYDEVRKAKLEDAAAQMRALNVFGDQTGKLSMLEEAELQEAAAAGDEEAKAKWEAYVEKFKKKARTEL